MKYCKELMLACLILAGCAEHSSIISQSHSSNESVQSSMRIADVLTYLTDDFLFRYPSKAEHQIHRPDGSIALATSLAAKDGPEDYYISIYNSISQSCAVASGVSHLRSLNQHVSWGKVDFYETYMHDYDPSVHRPLCYVPSGKDAGTYALCSQKNGKTVLICISQQKDNPEIAKQIFESFRWTDGNGSPEL